MQENKQKPLILKTLRFAKAEGGYNIEGLAQATAAHVETLTEG